MADFLWVEQYRPKTIEECILPKDTKKTFTEFLNKKEIPNMLLSGGPGTGKTTVARALCEQLSVDYIIINGSDEGRHIDTLRNKIKNFASTVSFNTESKHKVVIIDEADYMNAESVQPALRNFIETFHKNCRFIMTCNYPYKFIEPLRSRLTHIEFKLNGHKKEMYSAFALRLDKILKSEKVQFDKKVLEQLIEKYKSDFRKTINELQRYSVNGKIDSGIFYNQKESDLKALYKSLKGKEFDNMRKWVVNNSSVQPADLFKTIYSSLKDYLQPTSIPQAILLLAGYQYKSAFVADQEINMVACLTEIMATCKFK